MLSFCAPRAVRARPAVPLPRRVRSSLAPFSGNLIAGDITEMLTKYIENAMRLAHYELMENGRFFGSIPKCRGAWAEGRTLEECREKLQAVLEDWVLLGLQLGHRFPVIASVNLNRSNRRAAAHAKAH